MWFSYSYSERCFEFPFCFCLKVHHGSDTGNTGTLNGIVHSCLLAEGEFIQKLEYSHHLYWGVIPVFGCITLTTTDKICGPYGNTCGPIVGMMEGYHVLYVSGRNAAAFDSIGFAFEDC